MGELAVVYVKGKDTHVNSTSEAAILSSLPYPSLTYFNYHLLINFFFDKNGGIELETYLRKKNAYSAGIIIP